MGDGDVSVRFSLPAWIADFRRGVTVADMLRALLLREFPEDGGGAA